MTRRPTAVVLMLMIIPVVAGMSPCWAQEGTEDDNQGAPRYVGLVSWFPVDSKIWEMGYAVRMCDAQRQTYITGVLGLASPEAAAIQRGSEQRAARDRLFAGFGAGIKLAQSKSRESFVGVGATAYWVEGGPRGDGWVYVDGLGHVLGPAHGERFFISPEVTAHLKLGPKWGIHTCVNLSPEGQAPKKGVYVGLSLRK